MRHNIPWGIKLSTFFTLLCFIATNTSLAPSRVFAESTVLGTPVSKGIASSFEIPNELGSLGEILNPETAAPAVIHIQSAHGNYEAEKNIQAILHHLSDRHGFDLLFLEGGVGKLEPGLFNLFPNKPELNIKVADQLMKKAEMTGPELFLIENRYGKKIRDGKMKNDEGAWHEVKAYGIENMDAYRRNRKTFQDVLRWRERAESFLQEMNMQIKRLSAPYLNAGLKKFLKMIEAYETKRMEPAAFLDHLKAEAHKHLGIDLSNVFYQRDWPMLIRYFRMRENKFKISEKLTKKEKALFFGALKQLEIRPELLGRIESVFEGSSVSSDMRYVFEQLFEEFPGNINIKSYPHLRIYIQQRILESEFKGEDLFQELERLNAKVLDELAKTTKEKELVRLYDDYRLLQKLFALELTREDYERIQGKGNRGHGSEPRNDELEAGKRGKARSDLTPGAIMKRFLRINSEGRVKDVFILHLEEINDLYELALRFYAGAYEREPAMIRNILHTMKRLKKNKVILVTGGFHVERMKAYFESKKILYALVSPRITELAHDNSYHLAMLEAHKSGISISQIANILKLQPAKRIVELADNDAAYIAYVAGQLAQAMKEAGIAVTDSAIRNSQWAKKHPWPGGQKQMNAVARSEIRTDIENRINALLEKRISLWKEIDLPRTVYGQINKHVEVIEGAVRMFAMGDVHGDLNGLVEHLAAAYELTSEEVQSVRILLAGLKGKDHEERKSIYQEIIQKLDIEKGDVIAFAGDFVDRGEQSVEVVEFILSLKARAEQVDRGQSSEGGARVVAVMGNHDYAFWSLFQELENRYKKGEAVGFDVAEELARQIKADLKTVEAFYEKYYYTYEEMRNNAIVDFFLNDLKQVVVVDDNVLVHANIPDLSGIDNLDELEQGYEGMLHREKQLEIKGKSGLEGQGWDERKEQEIQKILSKGIISDSWEYVADWALPHPEGRNDRKKQQREEVIKKQTRNREKLYEMIVRQAGVNTKPSRLLVGHDPSLKRVGRIRHPLSDDVYHLDGGLAPFFRSRGTTPGILEFNAWGYIGVHQPLATDKSEQWRILFKSEALPELVLSSRNAETARRNGLVELQRELKQLRRRAESENPQSARPEIRAPDTQPEQFWETVLLSNSRLLKPENFKLILETLRSHDVDARRQALLGANYFLIQRPASRGMLAPYRQDIERVWLENHSFAKKVKESVESGYGLSLDELVKLQASLFPEGENEKRFGEPTADLRQLASWAVKGRSPVRVSQMQIGIGDDTGIMPSQYERGRFVALYLYLVNRVYYPTYYSAEPYGYFFWRDSKEGTQKLQYVFRVSSAAVESDKSMEDENFTAHLMKKLRETQLLNLGLLLASAEDSYRMFFPGESPGWMDGKMKAIAIAYRAFERRLVAFLREYNRFRDPDAIYQLQEATAKYQERRHAASNYLLEEVLFPTHSWLTSPLGGKNPMVRLLPFLRAIEAIELHQEAGSKEAGTLTLGREFIERAEEIGDEYLLAANNILSGNSFSKELSEEFLEAYREAENQLDPFWDTRKHKDATVYYVRKVQEALGHGNISLDVLPAPAKLMEAIKYLTGSLDAAKRDSAEEEGGTAAPPRLEVRLTLEELGQLQKMIKQNPKAVFNQKELLYLLEQLKNPQQNLKELAINMLPYFLWPYLPLDELTSYRHSLEGLISPYRKYIEEALLDHLHFAKIMKNATEKGEEINPDKIVRLNAGMGGKFYDEGLGLSIPDLHFIAQWILRTRSGKPVEDIVVYIPDQGTLPSQFERARFISLILQIAGVNLDYFRPFKSMETPNPAFGSLHWANDRRIRYSLDLSRSRFDPSGDEASQEMTPGGVTEWLREIQVLSFGLLLAGTEDSYRIFFPAESPAWMDARMKTIAQLYRGFERHFVSFLREYDQYHMDLPKDPENILKIQHDIDKERRDAFKNYRLEEILYPSIRWMLSEGNRQEGWNKELLPRLRLIEGMALHQDIVERRLIGGRARAVTRGDLFIAKSRRLLADYKKAIEIFISNPLMEPAFKQFLNSFGGTELLAHFSDAEKSSDPFINVARPFADREDNEEATRYYLRKEYDALSQNQILLPHFLNPRVFLSAFDIMLGEKSENENDSSGGGLRSERRNFMKTDQALNRKTKTNQISLKAQWRVIQDMMEGIIGYPSSSFDALFDFSVSLSASDAGHERLFQQASQEKIDKLLQEIGKFNGEYLKRLLRTKDDSFGVIAVAAPADISPARLDSILKELKPLFLNHARKVLIINYKGPASSQFAEEIFQRSERRFILFQGDQSEVLKNVYSGNFSKLSGSNQRFAKLFFARASELAGGPVKITQMARSSLIVAGEGFFKNFTAPVAKQFLDQPLEGLSKEDIFRAYLLYAIPYASLNNAVFLKEAPPEIQFQVKEESVLQFFFKRNSIQEIQYLTRAARRILTAA